MALREWFESNASYGKKLVNTGIEGARSGGETFLQGEPFKPFISDSVRKALKPAAVGAYLGLVSGYPGKGKSISRTLVFGLLGGVIGLGAGVLWESRGLTAKAADEAFKNIGQVRDEHWLAKHPIDYA